MPASITLVPASTSTVRSLIVTLGTLLSSVLEVPVFREGAAALADVRLDLFGEALHQRLDGAHGRVAQRAQRVAADVAGHGLEEHGVALAPLAVLETLEHQLHPVRALAARRALSAGLVVEELGQARHGAHHADRLV